MERILNEYIEPTGGNLYAPTAGRNSGEIESKLANPDTLVSMMGGRDFDHMFKRRRSEPSAEVAPEVRQFSRLPYVKNVSFQLRRGEILGLAGLLGAGRS